jgi:hypothetical protein
MARDEPALSPTPAKARMKLQLSLAIASNPRSWPILDGTVKPDGIDLVPTILHPTPTSTRRRCRSHH